jgi:hypothetical protein
MVSFYICYLKDASHTTKLGKLALLRNNSVIDNTVKIKELLDSLTGLR